MSLDTYNAALESATVAGRQAARHLWRDDEGFVRHVLAVLAGKAGGPHDNAKLDRDVACLTLVESLEPLLHRMVEEDRLIGMEIGREKIHDTFHTNAKGSVVVPDDILQEVWTQFIRHAEGDFEFRSRKELHGWFRTAIGRRVVDRIRKQEGRKKKGAAPAAGPRVRTRGERGGVRPKTDELKPKGRTQQTPSDRAAFESRRVALQAARDGLTSFERQVWDWALVHGRTWKEFVSARATPTGPDAAGKAFRRAVSKIAAELGLTPTEVVRGWPRD